MNSAYLRDHSSSVLRAYLGNHCVSHLPLLCIGPRLLRRPNYLPVTWETLKAVQTNLVTVTAGYSLSCFILFFVDMSNCIYMKGRRTWACEQGEEVQCFSESWIPEAWVNLEILLYYKSTLPKSLNMVKYNTNDHFPDQFRCLLWAQWYSSACWKPLKIMDCIRTETS